MSNANVSLVQNLYAAFGRGDIAAVLAGLAPDVDWQTIGQARHYPVFGPRKGIAAVREFFELVSANEDFAEFLPREFYPVDDKVFVLGRYTLKMKKTRRPVACEWVHVFTVKDGKVTRWREHTDTAQFAEAYRG